LEMSWTLFSFFLFLAGSLSQNTLWSGCETMTLGVTSIPVCSQVELTPSCDLEVSLDLSGNRVFTQNMSLSLSNQVCGKQTILGLTCDLCLTMQDNGPEEECIKFSSKCGIIPGPSKILGCFNNSVVSAISQCQANRCPGDSTCSGQGTCVRGSCICNPGYFGSTCSSIDPEYKYCVSLSRFSSQVCIDFKFASCQFKTTATVANLDNPNDPLTLFDQSWPLYRLTKIFDQNIVFSFGGCSVTLLWSNLTLTPALAAGCGSALFSCLGNDYQLPLGCFRDLSVVPQCLGACKNDCSFHGSCENSICTCADDYQGNDCSISPLHCIGYPTAECNGHGKCDLLSGMCTCTDNYSGSGCEQAPLITTMLPNLNVIVNDDRFKYLIGGVVVLIVILIAVVVGGIVVWRVMVWRKNRIPVENGNFRKLELEEE